MKPLRRMLDVVPKLPRNTGNLRISSVIFGLALLLSAGCSTVVNQTVTFAESDFQSYEARGTGLIQGHAFIRSDTGVKRGGAGIKISLVPLTAYTEERAMIMESGNEPGPMDPRLNKYVRTTVGDWGGAYRFEGLPAGKYLLYCKIEWEAQYAGSLRRDASGSSYALARTVLSGGEHKNVVITNSGQK